MINFEYKYENDSRLIEERFLFKFNPISRTLKPWRDEVLHTAQTIANSTTRPLMVCLSGGLDSEIIAKAFLECNIPFTAISFKHSAGTNLYDIEYAIRFCKKHNVEHKIIEFDFDDFLENKIETYIQQGYRSSGIFRYFLIFMLETIESMGGCAVMGAGEHDYKTFDNTIYLSYFPNFTIPVEWCRRNNTVHYPYFHMHNSEIFASYMKTDIVNVVLSDPRYFKTLFKASISLEKILLFHCMWDGMERRQKENGFKFVQDQRSAKEKELSEKFPDIQVLRIPVENIKFQLGI